MEEIKLRLAELEARLTRLEERAGQRPVAVRNERKMDIKKVAFWMLVIPVGIMLWVILLSTIFTVVALFWELLS